jgi:hypothetical protein
MSLRWTWTHGCVPRASGLKRKVSMVGPDDVTEGDVDPPKRVTCHRGCGRQLCYVGPEGKVNQDIRSRKVGEGSEYESLEDRNPKTRSPEVPKNSRQRGHNRFQPLVVCRRGPLIHPFSRVQ